MTAKGVQLERAGYRKYPKPPLMHADWLYQKRVRNAEGQTRYFINIYEFLPNGPLKLGYQAEMDGYVAGSRSVTITAGSWVAEASIEAVEAFFEGAFVALGFQNYEEGEC